MTEEESFLIKAKNKKRDDARYEIVVRRSFSGQYSDTILTYSNYIKYLQNTIEFDDVDNNNIVTTTYTSLVIVIDRKPYIGRTGSEKSDFNKEQIKNTYGSGI